MASTGYNAYLKDLEQKRAPSLAAATKLAEQGRYEEAEKAVLAVDDSIYGLVALGRMYTDLLRRLTAAGAGRTDKSRCEEVFRQALRMRHWAYPEPHTQCEADDFRRGREQDRAELVAILGYDPGPAQKS